MRMAAKKSKAHPDLEGLQEKIGYRFRDPDLLDLALTHRSRSHEAGRAGRDNEALEFLGDALIGFVIATRLFEKARGRAEAGVLSRRRASLISEPSLAALARSLGIGESLRLGKGEDSSGGRTKPSLLADAFEAVAAAILIDGGMEAARTFVLAHLPADAAAPRRRAGGDLDPKTRLQEILQAKGWPAPEYRVTGTAGPAHQRSFTVEVIAGGRSVGSGTSRSIKSAGVEAARAALRRVRSILARKEGT